MNSQAVATGNWMGIFPSFPKLNIVADASTLIHGRFPNTPQGLDYWVRAGLVRLYVPMSELTALGMFNRSRNVRRKIEHTRRWLDELAYHDNMVSIQKEHEGFPCTEAGIGGEWRKRQNFYVEIPERLEGLFSYVLWLAHAGSRDPDRNVGPSREIVVLSEDKEVHSIGKWTEIEVYSPSQLLPLKLDYIVQLYFAHVFAGDICIDQPEEKDDDLESLGNISEIAARDGKVAEDDDDAEGEDDERDYADYYKSYGVAPPATAPNLQINTAIFNQYINHKKNNSSSTTLTSLGTPTLTRTGESSPTALRRKPRTPTTPPPITEESADKVVAKFHRGWVTALRKVNERAAKSTGDRTAIRVISANDFSRDKVPAHAQLWTASDEFSRTRPDDADLWGIEED